MNERDDNIGVALGRPLSLQLMNVNKLIMTNDHGDTILEINSSTDTLEEYFGQFDRLIIGKVVFRREKP